ncbi:MAG TPA: hypothetical protein VF665_06690 [Longimicrobium sp.]|jgi:hypothetical protein|uniref:hypothetical protein n=1 Tax=Longimicrobium sp. TaxID=2029185 RepID=UPI002ED85FCA
MPPLAQSLRGRSLGWVLLMAVCAACTRAAPAALPADEPYVRGVVQSVRTNALGSQILVLSGGGCGLHGNTHANTHYLRRLPGGGVEAVRLVDVKSQQQVSVWVTGPVTRSCPPIGRISALVIEPE